MGDYESRILDVQLDINSLIERINRCDPSLCNEDWHGMTYDYDRGILEVLYQNIEVEEMFALVTNIICAECHRLELEGKIEFSPSCDNEFDSLSEELRSTLEGYANVKRGLLAAKRDEQETRERYAQQLMERKRDAWKRTQDVPITYYPDGTPDVEEYESRLADEVEDVLRENDTLLRRIGEKEEEIQKLRSEIISGFPKEPETAFNVQTNLPCFTNKQMGIFLRAVAEITEQPNPPAKTTLGDVVEKIAGYKSTTVNQNMKGTASAKDVKVVAEAIENKLPQLAKKVRKL